MRTLALLLSSTLLFINIAETFAQGARIFNNNVAPVFQSQGSMHNLFKASVVFGIKKGASLGLSYGLWKENPSLQYSLNTSLQWRFGRPFLGNYRNGANKNDSRSHSQLVFVVSPMLTVNLFSRDYVYQELEPFYLGTPNAVFSKYENSLTIGSSIVLSPKGTYRNVSTIRNRAQQDFMFALNIKNFNFTMFDDFFPVATTALLLGDNWDRFFTGGGFIRYRFNNEFTFHLYSEVYTGINRPNAFLSPDVISYKKRGSKWLLKNFANQNLGQEYFNASWLVAKLSYTGPQMPGEKAGAYLPNFDFLIGTTAPWTMFSQNLIHKMINYDKVNDLKLHYFLHRSNVPGNLEAGGKNAWHANVNSIFFGGGIQTNISMP